MVPKTNLSNVTLIGDRDVLCITTKDILLLPLSSELHLTDII